MAGESSTGNRSPGFIGPGTGGGPRYKLRIPRPLIIGRRRSVLVNVNRLEPIDRPRETFPQVNRRLPVQVFPGK